MGTPYDPYGSPDPFLAGTPTTPSPAITPISQTSRVLTVPPVGEPAVGGLPGVLYDFRTNGATSLVPQSFPHNQPIGQITFFTFKLASPNGLANNFTVDTINIGATLVWNNENAWVGTAYYDASPADASRTSTSFTDGQVTAGSNVLVSPSQAQFIPDDEGRFVGDNFLNLYLPPGTCIVKVISSTTVLLNQPARQTGNIPNASIGGWASPRGPGTPIFSDLPITWLYVSFNATFLPTNQPAPLLSPSSPIVLAVPNFNLYFAVGLRIMSSHGSSIFFYPGGLSLDIQDGGATGGVIATPARGGIITPYLVTYNGSIDYGSYWNPLDDYTKRWGFFNGGNTPFYAYYQNPAQVRIVQATGNPEAQAPVWLFTTLPPVVNSEFVDAAVGTAGESISGLTATYEQYAHINFYGSPDLGPGSVTVSQNSSGVWFTGGGIAESGFPGPPASPPFWQTWSPQPYLARANFPGSNYVPTQLFISTGDQGNPPSFPEESILVQLTATALPGPLFLACTVPNGSSVVPPSYYFTSVTTGGVVTGVVQNIGPLYGNYVLPITEVQIGSYNLYVS